MAAAQQWRVRGEENWLLRAKWHVSALQQQEALALLVTGPKLMKLIKISSLCTSLHLSAWWDYMGLYHVGRSGPMGLYQT